MRDNQLPALMRQNFIEYASYVVIDRAIPDIRDGCKPVQRRILATLFDTDDGKFHKVANIIGESMKLHPHGDVSIGDALVVLANKEYFIEKQGNFGNVITGHAAAASRYIECRLTDLARETLFNKHLTKFIPSYDGRKEEPEFLPSKLPVVLMLGTEGIAVGMATKILPHNFCELLEAQKAILKGGSYVLYPDAIHGGLMDVSEYDHGRGKVKLRARIKEKNERTIVVSEIPFSTTTEGLIASIEAAAQKNKVKIASINDYTTDKVEIELVLPRGTTVDEVIPQLYAYTDCEMSVSSNIVVIRDRRPVEYTVDQVLEDCTTRLRAQIKVELEFEIARLQDKQHWLTLERIFIEERVYKRLEKVTTEEGLTSAIHEGMDSFKKNFIRAITDDDVKRLLEIRIRRISAFDIARHHEQMEAIAEALKLAESKLSHLIKTVIAYLDGLLKKYGKQYPRRTEITTFESVDRKAVARQTLKVTYDSKSGFFGTQVKGDSYGITCSEYDLFLVISDDGSYRIMPVPEKVLLNGKILYCEIFDLEQGVIFTVVYRDKKKNLFAKKVHIHKFIRNKEYSLMKDEDCKVDLLLQGDKPGVLEVSYQAGSRQRVAGTTFDLASLELMGTTTRGIHVGNKPVSRVCVVERGKAKAPSKADRQGKLL